MGLSAARFLSLFFAALALAPAMAHAWTFTFPANRATQNWTTLPENWMALRAQWEYSHAASAVLNLAALVAVILSVLARSE